MDLYPAIDLRNGQVVRLFQGDYGKQTTYHADPVAVARSFEEQGARKLHVVDLDGAKAGRLMHLEQIGNICRETNLDVEVGGGVRKTAAIDALLAAGVRRVILGTAALQNWQWFESLMGNPTYNHRIVLGLDARDGKLAVSGWQEATDASPVDIAKAVNDWPLDGIVYTDIATDGTLAGPSLDSTREVAAATRIGVVASGGVGTLDHLRQLAELPLQGVIVGKALYEEQFTVSQALEALKP